MAVNGAPEALNTLDELAAALATIDTLGSTEIKDELAETTKAHENRKKIIEDASKAYKRVVYR